MFDKLKNWFKHIFNYKDEHKDEANYIPKSAIEMSHKARTPRIDINELRRKKRSAQSENRADPYTEDRISEDIPSDKAAIEAPPDDQVMPG